MDAERLDEVRTWIAEHWDPGLTLGAWWALLADAGLAFPHWPERFGGRGWTSADSRAVGAALAAAGAVGPPSGVGQALAGPTLLAHGTDAQRKEFVPALASGAESWCQLFSEPGAGSDLAGLQCRAERDGDGWVVNGQKVWNSGAGRSERGLLLARTNPEAPKHLGITYFVIDMEQPGIETRPLRQMNGEADFDEVFLADAQVPGDRIVGELGGGWQVAKTTLAFERAGIGSRTAEATAFGPGRRNGNLDQPIAELLAARADGTKRRIGGGFVLPPRTAVELAREHGRSDDPVVRQQLARYRSLAEVNRLTGQRARATVTAGGRPGPEASIGKLALSELARASRSFALELLGPYGMLAGDDAPHDGGVQHVVLSSFATGLGGGTDEIQRNVIGERALGLPREPE